MKKLSTKLVLVLICLISRHLNAEEIRKVIVLASADQMPAQLQQARELDKAISFHAFTIDEGYKILSHFERSFPQALLKESEQVKEEYLQKNIVPYVKSYAPEIMRGEFSLSLTKLFKVDRVPAVIINDKYVTYGLTIQKAIGKVKENR